MKYGWAGARYLAARPLSLVTAKIVVNRSMWRYHAPHLALISATHLLYCRASRQHAEPVPFSRPVSLVDSLPTA